MVEFDSDESVLLSPKGEERKKRLEEEKAFEAKVDQFRIRKKIEEDIKKRRENLQKAKRKRLDSNRHDQSESLDPEVQRKLIAQAIDHFGKHKAVNAAKLPSTYPERIRG